jgi:hypothetical protein
VAVEAFVLMERRWRRTVRRSLLLVLKVLNLALLVLLAWLGFGLARHVSSLELRGRARLHRHAAPLCRPSYMRIGR